MSKKPVEKNAVCELIYPGKDKEARILSSKTTPLSEAKAFGMGADANMLIHGENLSALKALLEMKREGLLKSADNTTGVRLVYIDPPFSTNLSFKSKKDLRAYDDKIVGAGFIEFLRERLVVLR